MKAFGGIPLLLAYTTMSTASVLHGRMNPSPNGVSRMAELPDTSMSEQQQPYDLESSEYTPSRYYGISLNINLARKGEQPVYGRAPVELNKLAQYSVRASEILVDQGAAVGVDVRNVACQAYSDADGSKPIDEEFDAEEPLELAGEGEELVSVGSVLCFVSGDLLEEENGEEHD
ncbi:hypothetical protein Slin14017_G053030 [Septoria linicola]|nr:hypothetical protein Slin14017_G053030 [Septoria linicola]